MRGRGGASAGLYNGSPNARARAGGMIMKGEVAVGHENGEVVAEYKNSKEVEGYEGDTMVDYSVKVAG